MPQNQEVRKYIDEVFMRYQTARQEVESMCCLSDTVDFIQMDVIHLLGIINSLTDMLDEHDLHSVHAKEFATNFHKAP